MVASCRGVGLDNIFLISPTTPEARIQTIVERGAGVLFITWRSRASRGQGSSMQKRSRAASR